jgi:CubicO group peptidase (beta-lactamase class C family)
MQPFPNQFPQTSRLLEEGISQGQHIGAQVYISLRGEPKADAAIGQSRPGIEMTTDTIMPWLSAGKPLTAVAIGQLRDSGRLNWDDPVGKFIPEFALKGKEPVTIKHLLTHTGGFRWADFTVTMLWETIIQRISAAPLEPRWVVGTTAGYHAHTSWFILGEIVRRLDPAGRPFDQFVRDNIFMPLDMQDSWLAMPPRRFEEYGSRIGQLQLTGSTHPTPVRFDQPDQAALCAPGASARGPIRELGKFYEMLLNAGQTPAGKPVVSRQTVAEITRRQRAGLMDLTFKHIVDWGLGFIVNSARYGDQTVPYGFGPHASPETFGHGGSQSSTAFADPSQGLVVAIVFNGMPGESQHQQRLRSTLKAVYEDLHLEEAVSGESDGIL